MPSTTSSARKPKQNIRALKEHKPELRIDVEKAESLLKELDNLGHAFSHKALEFEELLEAPFWSATRVGEAIDPNLGKLLESFKASLSDQLMRVLRGRDEGIEAMKGAVAALRLLRSMRLDASPQPDA